MPTKNSMTREELEAHLDKLDKLDEVKARDAEIARLTSELAERTRERDDKDKELRRVEDTMRECWTALRPYREALDSPKARLYRGAKLSTARAQYTANTKTKTKPAKKPAKAAARKKPSQAELTAHFPDLK